MALEHATITNLDTAERYEVLFNPDEYTVNKDNNFAQAAVPGLSTPLLQFVHGNLRTLDLTLFFDTYESHRRGARTVNAAGDDVRTLTEPVVKLMSINPRTHVPPVVLFAWGSLTFTGVVQRVNQQFTLFAESGAPLRGRLQVTFQEWKTPLQEAQEVRRETADYTRSYVVGEGETLSAIAARFYDDPAMWRPLALANALADPRLLPVGLRLTVPRLPYRDPATGDLHGAPSRGIGG